MSILELVPREQVVVPKFEPKTIVRSRVIDPSTDFAWVIGVIAGGGYVGNNSVIRLSRVDGHLEQVYKDKITKLFGVQRWYGGDTPSFSSKNIAELLGDLRNGIWPETIVEKHRWIVEEPTYRWSLIGGLFDARGRVDLRPNRRRISIGTKFLNVATLIRELLLAGNLDNPVLNRSSGTREGIVGVCLYNVPDIKKFAEEVRSSVPEKEEALEFYRQFVPLRSRFNQVTNEEVLTEWVRLRRAWERIPSWQSIYDANKRGETAYSPDVYAYRFGKADTGKSFSQAKDYIERTIMEKGVEDTFGSEDQLQSHDKRVNSGLIEDQDIIQEWVRIKAILGYNVTIPQIKRLYKEGRTKFSSDVYTRRFGKEGDFRSFVRARANLTTISNDSTDSPEKITDPPPVHITSVTDLEAIREWIYLRSILGGPPTRSKIYEIFRKGETKYGPVVYKYRFGSQHDHKSFGEAKGVIAGILEELVANGESDEVSDESLLQIILRRKELLQSAEGEVYSKNKSKPIGYWVPDKIREEAIDFYRTEGKLSNKSLKKAGRWDLMIAIRRKYSGKMMQLKKDIGEISGEELTDKTTTPQINTARSIEDVKREALEVLLKHGNLTGKFLEKLGLWGLRSKIDQIYPGRVAQLRVDIGQEYGIPVKPKKRSRSNSWTVEEMETQIQNILALEGHFSYKVLEKLKKWDLIKAIQKHYPGSFAGIREKFDVNTVRGKNQNPHEPAVSELSRDRKQFIMDEYLAAIKTNPSLNLTYLEYARQYLIDNHN